MSIVIWAGAQTGVDMGALTAALDAGLAIGGYVPRDGRNEDGPIPFRIMNGGGIRRCKHDGPAARTAANVREIDAAILVVQSCTEPSTTRGTALTVRLLDQRMAREPYSTLSYLVVDASSDLGPVATWALARATAHALLRGRALRLFVAGPRASLWPEGEAVARRVVARIAEVAGTPRHRDCTG